jgi:hypothetical protein
VLQRNSPQAMAIPVPRKMTDAFMFTPNLYTDRWGEIGRFGEEEDARIGASPVDATAARATTPGRLATNAVWLSKRLTGTRRARAISCGSTSAPSREADDRR